MVRLERNAFAEEDRRCRLGSTYNAEDDLITRADRSVEPNRSQNITVSWRRSALSARGDRGTVAGSGTALSPSALPQPPQNLAAVSFSKPQARQGEGSGVPHSAQKRRVAVFSAMQLGQRIRALASRHDRL
jgi:hypothetical protein